MFANRHLPAIRHVCLYCERDDEGYGNGNLLDEFLARPGTGTGAKVSLNSFLLELEPSLGINDEDAFAQTFIRQTRGLRSLSRHTALVTLTLQYVVFWDGQEAADALNPLVNLKHISLANISFADPSRDDTYFYPVCQAFTGMENLRVLQLDCRDMSEESIEFRNRRVHQAGKGKRPSWEAQTTIFLHHERCTVWYRR